MHFIAFDEVAFSVHLCIDHNCEHCKMAEPTEQHGTEQHGQRDHLFDVSLDPLWELSLLGCLLTNCPFQKCRKVHYGTRAKICPGIKGLYSSGNVTCCYHYHSILFCIPACTSIGT